ncbi:Hypothetical protein LOCK908_2054 [Lacticaseibacillus rhamnosus LOCK908]|nr:Hypothetical protein LOCK908_2054 [Lacticaseibacillus rhamnosus LOCK908]
MFVIDLETRFSRLNIKVAVLFFLLTISPNPMLDSFAVTSKRTEI